MLTAFFIFLFVMLVCLFSTIGNFMAYWKDRSTKVHLYLSITSVICGVINWYGFFYVFLGG